RGELVEPLVGHLDDADMELHPAEPAGLGVPASERVEDSRLARSGKPDDGDLHDAMLSGIGARTEQWPPPPRSVRNRTPSGGRPDPPRSSGFGVRNRRLRFGRM